MLMNINVKLSFNSNIKLFIMAKIIKLIIMDLFFIQTENR